MIRIRIDYRTDLLHVGRNTLPLESLRQYLIDNHISIVTGFYIRSVVINGNPELHFDWCGIHDQAYKTGIINEFLRKHYDHFLTIPDKPSDSPGGIQATVPEDQV